MTFPGEIATVEELVALHESPVSELARRKEIAFLDEHCRTFIAHSPFFVLATSDARGRCDASPRGGPAGFVRVLDDRRLLAPEAPGNRRFDSLRNLFENPHVGLIFMVPGRGETLRVNGRAVLTRDPELLAQVELNGRMPKLALGVVAEQVFLHCAKALKRSQLWEPDAWPGIAGLPPSAQILRDHAQTDTSVEEIDAGLEQSYATQLWPT